MKKLVLAITIIFAVQVTFAQTVGGGTIKAPSQKSTTEKQHKIKTKTNHPSEFMFLFHYAYSSTPQHSFGFTLGQNKVRGSLVGWYMSFMTGYEFCLKNSFFINSSLNTGDNLKDIPFFSGKVRKTRLSGTLGLTINLKSPVYLYLGAGYGTRLLSWEMVGGEWAKYMPNSYTGVNVDLGMIFNIKGFALSGGYSTVNFKYHEVKVGIGGIIKTKTKKKSLAKTGVK